jgi:hypothetical protein
MEWSSVRYDQDAAYEESLLQDILKKTRNEFKVQIDVDQEDKKLTLAELREKRIQAFTPISIKKT